MKIQEVIDGLKEYHAKEWLGKLIADETSRDQILYGTADKKCTGIVTTCFASARVIREAHRLGCNLIISHEALFWNHGDHTDWLKSNEVFQEKKKLLDEYGMTVWRDHDHIHAGIPLRDGTYADGIFYGFAKEMHWERYVEGDPRRSRTYCFAGITAKQLARELVEKMNLNGTRIVGDPDTIVHRARIPMHLIGEADNHFTKTTDEEHVDVLLTMEMTDFTTQEYIRDSAYLGKPRAMITLGHFNVEEPGMKFMAKWLSDVAGDLPVHYVQSGDQFQYITR